MKPRNILVLQLLLGSEAKYDWKQDADSLVIQPITKWPTQHAVAFKIALAE